MKGDQVEIGRMIKEVFREMPKDYDIQWLANRIHSNRRNIYRIFQKDNIDILLLWRISRALDHNFFQDLSDLYSQNNL